MRAIDSKAFGLRVKERRQELGLSQEQLGAKAGHSQSNIGWIEGGNAKRPSRLAADLAEPLQTTREWLLWKEGPKHVGPSYLPAAAVVQRYEALSPEMKSVISQAIEKAERSARLKRAG